MALSGQGPISAVSRYWNLYHGSVKGAVRQVGYGFSQLFEGCESAQAGDMSPFNALMMTLAEVTGRGYFAPSISARD